MSIPLTLLTVGASVGIGAVSVPMIGSVLSKPITGENVPTRIVDLAGYLTASGEKGLGFEDPTLEQSIGDVAPGVGASANPTAPTVSVPRTGGSAPNPNAGPAPVATADKKRVLAVASFASGLAIAAATFFLVRRVMR